jgi:acyl-CoA synthetase (NDP forming)
MSSYRTPELEYIWHPRSIAVVGVSTNPDTTAFGSGGNGFLRALQEMGFPTKHPCVQSCTGADCATGCLYPVNPKATQIEGLPCYPSLRAITGPVDYVISSVPAAVVPGLLDDAAAKGVRVIHFFTAGFSETGDDDRAGLEQLVLAKARAAGIRIIGPNCMGLYAPDSGLAFMQGFPTEAGRVALISQSGANAGEFVRYAAARGLRFSKVVSYGNALDLNESDFFEYAAADRDTDIICAYIEGVRDGRRFAQVLREVARRKPVVILKGGRTEAGSRAAGSHTGSLAGSIQVFDALCRQAGALRAESLDDLVDIATAFNYVKPPAGPGVAVIGAGGGTSVLAADEIAAAGLQVPPLPADVQDAFREFTPVAGTSVRNPIDTMAVFNPAEFVKTFELAARPDAIHSIIYHTSFAWGGRMPEDYGQRIEESIQNLLAARRATDKPILISTRAPISDEAMAHTAHFADRCAAEGFAVFPGIHRAAVALAALLRRQQLQEGRETAATGRA